MRVLQLNLLAFGPFSGVTLDLSQGNAGLHVVYGANEAGKSTALRAIHAALFGIPHQTSDNFVHDHPELRVGASLQNSAGQRISFVRRKGRKATLLNTDPQLGPHPDSALLPFLGQIDADTYSRVFGIGHQELRRGGDEMRRLRGLCGESLFAAGLGSLAGGGTGLADVLKQLDEQAAEIYAAKKRSSSIKLAKAEYEAVIKQKRVAEFSSSQWQQLQKDLRAAQGELENVRDQLLELRARGSRLNRLRDALKPLAQRQQLLDELAGLGDAVVLPETYSSDERVKCQAALDETRRRIALLDAELHAADGLQSQLADIHVTQGLLEHEQVVSALQQRLGAHLKAVNDRITVLNPRRGEILARIAELRRALGIVADVDLEPLRLTSDRRVAIQNLANQERSLRGAPYELAARRDELRHALEAALRERDSLDAPRDLSELWQAIERARAGRDLEEQLALHQHALASRQQETVQQLAALGHWSGSLVELVRLPLPLRETVDRFEHEFADNREQQRLRGEKCEELSAELARITEQLATLEKSEHLPTEQDLCDLRQHRDHGWTLVRSVWQQGMPEDSTEVREFTGAATLADAFQQSVAEADLVADRLRREAERITKRITLGERQTRLEQQLMAEQQQLSQCRQQHDQLRASWRELWEPLAIQPVLTPREMRGWLERHAQLKAMAVDLDRCQAQLQQTSGRYADCRGRLAACLAGLMEHSLEEHSLAELLQLALSLVDEQTRTDARRAELERDTSRISGELRALQGRMTRAEAALADWQIEWREAMLQIGCSQQASAEQANERISRLDELFAQLDDFEKLDMRIRDIESDALEFAQGVRELVSRLAPDMESLPVEQAAAQLQARWKQASSDQVRRDQLVARVEQRQRELDDLRRRERDLAGRLDYLCQVAGVAASGELTEVERVSGEVTQRRARLQEVEGRLLDLCGGTSIEQLAADAEGCGVDQLTARIAELQQQIEQLDGDREERAARVRELENACAAADGSPVAAEADERGLGILARMHADAERYLRLRVAASLLRQQIERFRAENQDPLLTRASTLFSRLTCREFAGLRTDYGADDQPVILGVRGNEQCVAVEAMSDGTCDQLYLALRLAYLERRLAQHEPLPLVVDDVLINFDNDRARATLQVLAELSQQTQIIFFTHHRHLVQIAETSLSDQLYVQELDRRASDLEQPVAVSGARRPR